MDDEENIGGNAGTDHDEAVLNKGWLQIFLIVLPLLSVLKLSNSFSTVSNFS